MTQLKDVASERQASRGNHFAEATVLALAHAYEQATAWHARRPSLT